MIKTFTGPMHSGKTEAMISKFRKIWNKDHVLMFKPRIDTRDGNLMKSKAFEDGIPVIFVDTFEDILPYINDGIRTIFIDEAQFFKGDVRVLSYLSIYLDMDIYVAGLNMTSEQEPFLIMPLILAISDEVEVIKGSCFDCGRDAAYTFYEGGKSEAIVVGDDNYVPLCSKCLNKRLEKGFSLKKN